MVQTWSGWKRFPDAEIGEFVEAPVGPGVYEVRHTMTGRVVAFGHAANVADTIADLKLNGGVSSFAKFFGRQPAVGPAAGRLAQALGYRLGGAPPGLTLLNEFELAAGPLPAVLFLTAIEANFLQDAKA